MKLQRHKGLKLNKMIFWEKSCFEVLAQKGDKIGIN